MAKNLGAVIWQYADDLDAERAKAEARRVSVTVEPKISVSAAEEIFVTGAQTEKGRQVIVNQVRQAQLRGE